MKSGNPTYERIIMRKNITKTVTISRITATAVLMNDDSTVFSEKLKPLEVLGEITLEKAKKIAMKNYPDEALVKVDVDTETNTYTMPVSEFIAHASIVEDESKVA